MGVITEKLRRFLEDKRIYKTGVEIHLDGEKLKKDWGIEMKGKVLNMISSLVGQTHIGIYHVYFM